MTLSTSPTLLQRVKNRDDSQAWNQLVKLYTPLLLKWAKQAGLDDASSQDTAQDVFIILVSELPKFEYDKERGSFRGWLKTITLRKVFDARRKLRPQSLSDATLGSPIPSGEDLLSRVYDREDNALLVQQALRVMQEFFEEKTWRACWEMTVNSRPAKEVAAELGISESSAFVAKSRVLRRLRQELEGMMDE